MFSFLRRTKLLFAVLLSSAVVCLSGTSAQAEPILQLYLEGSTYDAATESWVLAPPGSSGGDPFRLWALGNVSGPGGKGDIIDVFLSAVYDSGIEIDISLTPSRAGGIGVDVFAGFIDPSTPSDPGMPTLHPLGDRPVLGDGTLLPAHGEYGVGRTWQEFSLGDFDQADSPGGDFINTVPDPVGLGFQINVYEIRVTSPSGASLSGLEIHFDLYNTIEANNHAKFAPFSHDATIIPEPSSLILAGMGCFGMFGYRIRRRRKEQNER